MVEEKKVKISNLMNQILNQISLQPATAIEISKEANLDVEEGYKILTELEKMGLLECYYRPTDFALELIKLRTENED